MAVYVDTAAVAKMSHKMVIWYSAATKGDAPAGERLRARGTLPD
jgi:hypothetical protein